MQLEKHTLVNDFPSHQHTILRLKMNDNYFAKLFDEYHKLESEVHHIERNDKPVADEYLDTLKIRRVHLKDQLFNLMVKAENAF
ncbi:MAG: hypothetical protein ACI936_001500 [Paraglaciecola sp.]|jgi:uncharacterized protein YdcH (DUF465 family)